jgi:hypothetical protein
VTPLVSRLICFALGVFVGLMVERVWQATRP